MKMSNEELAAASSHAITGAASILKLTLVLCQDASVQAHALVHAVVRTVKVGYETRPRFLRFLRCGGLHPTPMHVPDIVVAYA
jgi:hypothetical protein